MAALDLGLQSDPSGAIPKLLALLPEARAGADNGIERIVLGELVRLYVSTGDLANARAYAEDLLRASVEEVIPRAHAYCRLGEVCMKQGDSDAARKAFQQVLDLRLEADVYGAVADDLNLIATRRLAALG